MYHLTVAHWPYRFVARDEYPRFARDMDKYYLQLALRSLRPPSLNDFISSPFPFFFEFVMDREEFADPTPTDIQYFAQAKKGTDEYLAYCEDVVAYFTNKRYAHEKEPIKGGGFSCLSC